MPSQSQLPSDSASDAAHFQETTPDLRRGINRRRDQALRLEITSALKQELEYLDSGAYGQFVRTPDVPSPIFKMSPLCLHPAVGDNSCADCALWSFVPPARRSEAIPCHHIPLDSGDTTVSKLSFGPEREVEAAVRAWLHSAIKQLEDAA
jgi:hypothetical protein